MMPRRHVLRLLAVALLAGLALVPSFADDARPQVAKQPASASGKPADDKAAPAEPRKYVTETLRGKVVWLADALERQFGVRTEADAAHSAVVLETSAGRLVPIVPDTRGWAFTVDERLRDVELELRVRRYERAPHVQVIRVLRREQGELYEIDYWCDICAIPMFILKPCECCQGETRLREQKVDDTPALPALPSGR